MIPNQTRRNGFTLIEISIVLVIIGLVVGGILTGRDLIRASELNYIVTQKSKYDTATNAYRSKYNELPGDGTNATKFLGIAGGNASDNYTDSCIAMVGLGTNNLQTCNGDGDGHIGYFGPEDWMLGNNDFLLFWHHLSLAKMIDTAKLTPRGDPAVHNNALEVPGFNIPASKLSESVGFSQIFLCSYDGLGFFHNVCAHTYFYGAISPTEDPNYMGMALYPTLSAMDAYSIDKKYDDGRPATGSIMTPLRDGYNNTCPSTDVISTATYTVTTPGITCALLFKAGF